MGYEWWLSQCSYVAVLYFTCYRLIALLYQWLLFLFFFCILFCNVNVLSSLNKILPVNDPKKGRKKVNNQKKGSSRIWKSCCFRLHTVEFDTQFMWKASFITHETETVIASKTQLYHIFLIPDEYTEHKCTCTSSSSSLKPSLNYVGVSYMNSFSPIQSKEHMHICSGFSLHNKLQAQMITRRNLCTFHS